MRKLQIHEKTVDVQIVLCPYKSIIIRAIGLLKDFMSLMKQYDKWQQLNQSLF